MKSEADLDKRYASLVSAKQVADTALGSKLTPDSEKFEKDLATRIAALVDSVREMTANCDLKNELCDLDKLARDRFELRDLMQRATTIDQKVLEDLKKATLAETPALNDRHIRRLTALEPARKISFVVHEDRSEADELVDRVKAQDADLTQKEKEHQAAKELVRLAKETHDRGLIEQRKAEEKEADAARAESSTKLAEIESKARDRGVADRAKIAKIDEELKSGKLDIDQPSLVSKRKLASARLGEIESLVTLPTSENPLYRIYDDDYQDWWINQFYLGGEFDSASGILNRGFARMGYTSWWHAGGENVPESHPRSGWGNYGRHYIFNALLTSTAEQNVGKLLSTPSTTDPCATNTTSAEKCIRRALETEQSIWVPLFRDQRHNRLRLYAGPVVSFGAKFLDPNENNTKSLQADYRYYAGLRAGFARDMFGQLLLGRTRSLRSHRLEVNGEVPVAKWGAKSRLLLGWTANLRAGGKEAFTRVLDSTNHALIVPERDVYRVYVVYELDFLTLTGLQPPK